MRAAIMRNYELVVDEYPEPVPGPGEVLVRTRACGICGSDLHALLHARAFVAGMQGASDAAGSQGDDDNGMDLTRDVVMGHEFCAEILDYGANTRRQHAPGALVCSMPITMVGGRPVSVGYSNARPGGYAERMLLCEDLLLPVPNGLTEVRAALTEPLAVGLHAVEMARLHADDVPLVIGCGPIGLAVINVLRHKGVHPIIAADYSPMRRKLAEVMGADVVIDPKQHSPYESWAGLSELSRAGERMGVNPLNGQPILRPGVFFECVGIPGVIDQMMVGARRGCRFVIVGVCMEQDHIRPLLAINKELNLQFVLAYTAEEFATTLRLIAEGELLTDPLVTGRVGIAEVPDAFRALANPEAHAKIIVEPWR